MDFKFPDKRRSKNSKISKGKNLNNRGRKDRKNIVVEANSHTAKFTIVSYKFGLR